MVSKEAFTEAVLKRIREKQAAKMKSQDAAYNGYMSDLYRDRRSLRRKMGHKIFMELDIPVANFDGGRCPYKL